MHVLEYLKRMTPAECREVGELFLSFADRPRDAAFVASLDLVLAKFQAVDSPGVAEALNAARRRVMALNDGLLAEGLNHEKLLAEELARRGDKRTAEEYCREVCGGSADSDVIHGQW